MAQDRNKSLGFVNTVMNLQFQKYARNFLTGRGTVSISRSTFLHEIRLNTIEFYGTCLMV